MEYVWLANFTGCPAISCPAGFSPDRAPIGVMAMGEWGAEEDLIAFARDGVGILGIDDTKDADADANATASPDDAGSSGLRIPGGDGSFWEDVIANAGA